eukprot:scaffold67695_cov64-Attheya_sp.AAC.2
MSRLGLLVIEINMNDASATYQQIGYNSDENRRAMALENSFENATDTSVLSLYVGPTVDQYFHPGCSSYPRSPVH